MKLMIEIEWPDNITPCLGGCEVSCPFSYYDDDTREYICDHVLETDSGFECIVSKAMKTNTSDMKDKECKAYVHTYKCGMKSCEGCAYRYEKKDGE